MIRTAADRIEFHSELERKQLARRLVEEAQALYVGLRLTRRPGDDDYPESVEQALGWIVERERESTTRHELPDFEASTELAQAQL